MKNTRIHPLINLIAIACAAGRRCEASGNGFGENWSELLDSIEKDILPSGSGIDCGTKIDREKSDGSRVTLTLSYHHMDENGGYCGWSDYRITARPDLEIGFSLTITGQNRNGIKEYLADVFSSALSAKVEHDSQNQVRLVKDEVVA